MAPQVGRTDLFEQRYREKFRSLAANYGLLVHYSEDRATLDLGLHLFEEGADGNAQVTDTRVWFQLKGRQTSSLSLQAFNELAEVAIDVPAAHLRYWYAHPEAVYLVVYVESADIFLAEDARDVAERCWGRPSSGQTAFLDDRKTIRVALPKTAVIADAFWRAMKRHRTLRVDRPTFRGRPLGHRLDPLRCRLDPFLPGDFNALVTQLLRFHRFRVVSEVPAREYLPGAHVAPDGVRLLVGVMTDTFEWIFNESVRSSFTLGWEYRDDGQLFRHQGPCAVLVLPGGPDARDDELLRSLELAGLKQRDSELSRLIAFVNDNGIEYAAPAGFVVSAARRSGFECVPVRLDDLAYNILTTTLYHDFRDKCRWTVFGHLIESDGPAWISVP